jgi:hypothetical protein
MTQYLKIIGFISGLLVLNGCSTLSKEECFSASWYELGVKNGRDGRALDILARHQDACAEYGIKINESEYLTGRKQGLSSYCQLTNAFDTGLRGERYQAVCPREIDAVFDRYNDAAYQVYLQRGKLNSLESSLSSKESSLSSSKIAEDKKNRIRDEIEHLERDHRRLRDGLYSLERSLDQLMNENRYHQ